MKVLLVAEDDDRVDARGASGWDIAGQQGGRREQHGDAAEGDRIDRADEGQNPRQHGRKHQRDRQAGGDAEDREPNYQS